MVWWNGIHMRYVFAGETATCLGDGGALVLSVVVREGLER